MEMAADRTLSLEQLLRSAEAMAGARWQIPDDDPRVRGLQRLVGDVGTRDRRNPAKVQALRLEILRLIAASIAIAADGVASAPVPAEDATGPLFVIGFGRTGSTFLHNLLALDPAARAPQLWELWYPSPPPKPESYADDRRIALTRSMLEHFERTAPLILQIHPMDPQGPDECHHLMLHTTHMAMMYDARDYWEWLRQLGNGELHHLYSDYKRQIGYLQRFFPGRRWVSKALAHLHYLPVLFDVFPGARVVRLHRDPCELIPSHCSLYANLRKLFHDSVDPVDVGRMVSDIFFDGMERVMRADAADTSRRYIDVMFHDLVANPIGTVADIYAHVGYEYSMDFDQAMKRYLAGSPKAMRSNHSYGLDEFGLTRRGLTERSEAYLSWLKERRGMRLVG
jgi:hypothetical protein